MWKDVLLHCTSSFSCFSLFPSSNALQFLVCFCSLLVVKAGMTVVKAVGLVTEVLLSVVVPLQLKCYSSFQHYLMWMELASVLSMGLITMNYEKQATAQKLQRNRRDFHVVLVVTNLTLPFCPPPHPKWLIFRLWSVFRLSAHECRVGLVRRLINLEKRQFWL